MLGFTNLNSGIAIGIINLLVLDPIIRSRAPTSLDWLLFVGVAMVASYASLGSKAPEGVACGLGVAAVRVAGFSFAAFPLWVCIANLMSGSPRIFYPDGLASGIQRDARFTLQSIAIISFLTLPFSLCVRKPGRLTGKTNAIGSLQFNTADLLLFASLFSFYIIVAFKR